MQKTTGGTAHPFSWHSRVISTNDSRPSRTGICRSMMMRSWRPWANAVTASAPFAAWSMTASLYSFFCLIKLNRSIFNFFANYGNSKLSILTLCSSFFPCLPVVH